MNLFGAIGLALALKNYKKALAEYNDEVDVANSVNDEMAAEIALYEGYTADIFNTRLQKGDPLVDYEHGELINILSTPVLHVADFYKHVIEGLLTDTEPREVCKVAPQVILKNIYNERIQVYGFGVSFKLFGEYTSVLGTDEYLRFTLDPEQMVSITFPLPTEAVLLKMRNSQSFLLTQFLTNIIYNIHKDELELTDELQRIKDYLIKRYGELDNVPCPLAISEIDKERVVTADIEVWYCTESDKNIRRETVKDMPGVLEFNGQSEGLIKLGIGNYSTESWKVATINE